MSITGKLKSVLFTYSFVISISINLFTTGSEAAGGPPSPPPPPGWTSQAASSNNTGSGGQTTQPESSKSTSSSKKPSSSIKTPPTQSLEVPTPTGEFGKKYAKLINPDAAQVILMSSFSTKIISLIRDELTLKDFAADTDKILTLFSKKNDEILGKAKEKYKELIKDPYIAQFVNTKNANQQTGDFLDSKLFDEGQEEATLRLLSLEQLDAQRKQKILSKQGDILEQLKFIKENSEILGAYGKTASTDISKKLPKELPKILSQQGDILGQLKFINKNSEILGEHSKATLKDKLKELSKQLDKISSNQLVGFILDENKINTNLKNVPFSKKEVRELIDSLNNKILEKIFLQDDGTITEQDLTRILQRYKETDLIKNLTKAIVYIDGNESNETVNKTLEKGLENTTPEQRSLIVDVLTNNTRIRKALITKIDRERKQEENKKLQENTEGDPLLEGLKKALAQRKSTTQETIDKQIEESKREKETASTTGSENVWDRLKNMNNPDNQNDNQNTQDENNKGWKEDNQNAQDENNNDVDRITKAKQELEQAVNAATRKFSEMSSLLKDNTIKNATACQGYLKGAEDQLTLAEEKGKELIEHSVQAFKIIPKKYQDDMDENWQNYLLPEEITELTTLEAEIKTLKSKQNKFGKFTSKTDLSEFRTKQEELQILSERLREGVVTKQKKQLVQNYVDEMVTNAKKAVEKIETTLEDLNKKKENKHNNAESSPLISKEILEAQNRLKKAETVLSTAERNYELAKRRGNISDSDSDDDDSDNESDKKITPIQAREIELNDAKEKVAKAKKNLEDAEAKDAERKQQEAEAKHKAVEAEAKRKAEKAETECLEDMVSMFKNAEDEAEQKEEVERQRQEDLKRQQDEAEHQRQEDLKRQQDEAEHQRQEDLKRRQDEAERQEDLKHQQDEAERQRQEDLKRKQDETERQRQEDLKRQQDEANRKAAEDEAAKRKAAEDDTRRKAAEDEANKAAKDEATRKAEKAEAEYLAYMASMFKNAEDEANKVAKDEATRKAEKAEAECLEDMASMFKNAEDEANRKAAEDEATQKEEIKRQRQEEQNRQEQERKRLADEEAEQKRKQEETEGEESKKDIALESEDEAIDMSFKTEAIAEQDETTQRQQVSAETNNKVAVLEVVDRTISVTNKHIYSNIFNNRLDIAPIVAAGDEEPTIARGIWISGLYGINKQGTWKNIPKYQGRTTGVTIGADAEFINSHDVIGIAYSRLESQIKYNKKLGKTAINGHLLSIYGLKELIKGFPLQVITSYGHNYIKNKSKNINNIIGKYQNNNLSFQTLLNYKYRTKYDLHFIPNIGFKYDYSRASNYKEYNVDIENLMIQKKSNQSFESSIGGKIVFKPIATVNNIILTPSLYGNIERHFNNKNTKVNAKATFKGQTLQETIIIPKQPKLGYNIGSNILMSRKNINVLLEYNYYTHKKYQSHQGLVKLKVNL